MIRILHVISFLNIGSGITNYIAFLRGTIVVFDLDNTIEGVSKAAYVLLNWVKLKNKVDAFIYS